MSGGGQVKQESGQGLVNLITAVDLSSYKIWNVDDDSNPSYMGFVDQEGNWIIIREDDTANPVYAWAKGTSADDKPTIWAGRVGLTYARYDVTF